MPGVAPTSCEALLRAMVGFETVNGRATGRAFPEKALAEYLESVAAGMGLAVRRLPIDADSHNVLVTSQSRADAPWLLFESHLDTVSIEGMTVEPLAGQVRDGRLYGRGSCDTKGTGAAMLWALRDYQAGQDRPNNVAIVFTTDEEMGKTGVRAYTMKQMAGLDFRPAAAVVGEPTLLLPVIAHNGMVRWQIRTTGVAAHSSDPSRGKSAISMMVKVIDAIERRYIAALDRVDPLTGKAACSINIIRGGVQVNVIPESCIIDLDRRVVPGETIDSVLPTVEGILDDLRRADPDLKVTQENVQSDVAFEPRGSEKFVAHVRSVLRSMGLPYQTLGAPYGTDASTLYEAGIPTVIIGPGDMAQAHTKDEFIALRQLDLGVAFYLRLMRAPLES